MKRFLCGVLLACSLMPALSQGVATAIAGGLTAKEVISQLNDKLTERISQATSSGDFLMEKAARELQLLLANGDTVLQGNINKTFDNLTHQQQQFLKGANDLSNKLDDMAGKLMSIEQFAAMDLNTILGTLPFVDGNRFPLRSVAGYSQVYQTKGVYKVTFVGQAFKQGTRVLVTINDQTVQLLPFSQDYVAVAEIPVELVNDQFAQSDVKRIKLKVQSWAPNGTIRNLFGRKEKQLLSFDTELLLLPKKPTTVELFEITAGKGWSDQVYTITGDGYASPTGKSGNWRTYEVSVTIPTSTLLLADRMNSWVAAGVGAGTWGNWCSGYQFTDIKEFGPTRVSRAFCHQIHDQSRTLRMEASYRKPVIVAGQRPVVLTEAFTGVPSPEGLTYDTIYEATFSGDYAGFKARFKMFNGQVVDLIQSSSNERGVEFKTDITSSLKKATFQVRNPYEKRN